MMMMINKARGEEPMLKKKKKVWAAMKQIRKRNIGSLNRKNFMVVSQSVSRSVGRETKR